MKSYLKIIIGGMLISFLGSLPPGHLTIGASYITAKQGIADGFIFSTGAMLAEIIVVRLALSVMDWMASKYKFFLVMEIITVFVFVAITIGCFYLATHVNTSPVTRSYNITNLFITGFLISIINPIHIPFWIGWSGFLMNRSILFPKQTDYNWYVMGIGIGSMFGYMVFIYGGEFLLNSFNENQNIILLIFGIVLFIVTGLHIRKMIRIPAPVRYSTIFKERTVKL